jgi:hypothetical protein
VIRGGYPVRRIDPLNCTERCQSGERSCTLADLLPTVAVVHANQAYHDHYYKPARLRLRGLAGHPAIPADEQLQEVDWALRGRRSWTDEQVFHRDGTMIEHPAIDPAP